MIANRERLVAGAIAAVEKGCVPDKLTRWGIRRLCRARLDLFPTDTTRTAWQGPHAAPWKRDFLALMDSGPIAADTDQANQQHYELPPEFFAAFLGPRRKYSACLWSEGATGIAEAEEHSLKQICQRAEVADGMDILDLGCGWGSLSLWILQHYPNCRVTSVSNSRSQRESILNQARQQGWEDRLQVFTEDMNHYRPENAAFDRVMSIEMFEHMRNHRQLLQRIRPSLRADGKLFLHVFCHKQWPYLFDVQGPANWMGRYFFTGGMMPSFDQLEQFPELFTVQDRWQVNGVDYGKTLDAWLEIFDRRGPSIDPILQEVYGSTDWPKWKQRWRVFLMASSELFRYRQGREWFVAHYRLTPTP